MPIPPAAIAVFLSALALLLAGDVPNVGAQTLQQVLTGSPAEKPPEGPSLEQRLDDARQRLQVAKQNQEEEASAFRKQKVELLTRLESSLTQLAAVEQQIPNLRADQTQLQEELEALQQDDIEYLESITFLRLEQARDEWDAEKRRLEHLAQREVDASLALEESKKTAHERSVAKRQAQERHATNKDDAKFKPEPTVF